MRLALALSLLNPGTGYVIPVFGARALAPADERGLRSLSPERPELGLILKGVERRYNNARTLAVRFEQTHTAQKRRRTERGELFLRKPGRMRWQYSTPAGKLFVSDGKSFFLYTPDNHRVERTRVKESEDWRAPLAFLLGRLDFQRDFKRFTVRPQGADTWIVAEPRSDRLAYSQVGFLVNDSFEILRLEITGQDRSVMEYRFEGERLNPPLEESLFRFQAPPGAEVVDVESEANAGTGYVIPIARRTGTGSAKNGGLSSLSPYGG